MSESAIRQIEQLLAASIPSAYLQALKEYPESLKDARRAIDDSEKEGRVSQVEFLCDLQDVVLLNEESRSDPILEPSGHEFFWPEQLLVIGETGSGDYYCLDIESPDDEVIQFDHQATEFEVVADSLREFIAILEETFCGAETDSVDQAPIQD